MGTKVGGRSAATDFRFRVLTMHLVVIEEEVIGSTDWSRIKESCSGVAGIVENELVRDEELVDDEDEDNLPGDEGLDDDEDEEELDVYMVG